MAINRDVQFSERCAAAFDKMFWAYIFFLDFRLGFNGVNIDILPDIVGWILMSSALSSIMDLSPSVLGTRTLANWLIFLSIFDIFEIEMGNDNIWFYATAPIGLAVTVLTILFIWGLCGLIMNMATAAGDTTLFERARFRRNLYVACLVALFVAVWICFAVPPFAAIALFVVFPLSIVVFCLMMALMKATARFCRGEVL